MAMSWEKKSSFSSLLELQRTKEAHLDLEIRDLLDHRSEGRSEAEKRSKERRQIRGRRERDETRAELTFRARLPLG